MAVLARLRWRLSVAPWATGYLAALKVGRSGGVYCALGLLVQFFPLSSFSAAVHTADSLVTTQALSAQPLASSSSATCSDALLQPQQGSSACSGPWRYTTYDCFRSRADLNICGASGHYEQQFVAPQWCESTAFPSPGLRAATYTHDDEVVRGNFLIRAGGSQVWDKHDDSAWLTGFRHCEANADAVYCWSKPLHLRGGRTQKDLDKRRPVRELFHALDSVPHRCLGQVLTRKFAAPRCVARTRASLCIAVARNSASLDSGIKTLATQLCHVSRFAGRG